MKVRRHPETGDTERITSLLESLPLPDPFDVDALVQSVAEQRGRPMIVVAEPDMGRAVDNVCGLWVQHPSFDSLHIRDNLAPIHRAATILHELGHVLFDHRTPSKALDLASLLPGLAESGALRMHARTRFDAPSERDAETFARTVLARVEQLSARPDPADSAAPKEIRPTLHRLHGILDSEEHSPR